MKSPLNWDDYRTVLLIAGSGTLSAAARKSGASPPTMMRRLDAVEARLGARLFDRLRGGYVLTPAGEDIASAARAMQEVADETERRLIGQDSRPSGKVHLTTTDILYGALLAPVLAGFGAAFPEITLEITVSNSVLDLAGRAADIALRPASAPNLNLVGRRLGVIRQAAYVRKDLGLAGDDGCGLPWVGPSAGMGYDKLFSWMRDTLPEGQCMMRLNSTQSVYHAVRAGSGVAILPVYLAETDPDLVRLGPVIDELNEDLWLLTHPDLKMSGRVRAVLDHIADEGTIGAVLASDL